MIELKPDHWVHQADLRGKPFGRDDPPEIVERCIQYLERGRQKHVTQRAHRAKGRLNSARVRTAAGGAVEKLRQELMHREWIIDRLLAFVPRRAKDLPPQRLTEIAQMAAGLARDEFGPGEYVPLLSPETDPDSSAAHRLTLSASPEHDDPERWAHASFRVQRGMVEELDDEELEALRLVIVPDSGRADGPEG